MQPFRERQLWPPVVPRGRTRAPAECLQLANRCHETFSVHRRRGVAAAGQRVRGNRAAPSPGERRSVQARLLCNAWRMRGPIVARFTRDARPAPRGGGMLAIGSRGRVGGPALGAAGGMSSVSFFHRGEGDHAGVTDF